MSLAVANRNGGKTSERGLYSSLGAAMSGDVISGFRVRPETTLSMQVRIGGEFNSTLLDDRGRLIDLSDNAIIRDGLGFYSVFTDDGQAISATVPTAHASLARRDYVVLYIKKSQDRVKSPVDNANGVVQAAVVAGVPAASPSVPSASAIQTAIGAGNPYIILAQLNVSAGDTTITTSKIIDLRMSATGVGTPQFWGADAALRPDRTLPLDGRAVNISDYSLLFRYIGHQYAFDENNVAKSIPANQFFLPNWQGRVPVGLKSTDTDFNTLGKSVGSKTHTLTAAQMPSVTGSIGLHGGENGSIFVNVGGAFSAPNGYTAQYKAPPASTAGSQSVLNSIVFNNGGGGQAHNILQPSTATNFLISC